MKAKALKRCRRPAYPTRCQVVADPALLHQNLPPAWRTPALAGVVAVFLAANATLKAADKGVEDKSKSLAAVAPIFIHGEGRGADGCIVVNPPVFLSEQEALQVIKEELAKAGVKLEVKQEKLDQLIAKKNPWQADDAHDASKKVKVEFVSKFDFGFLETKKQFEEKPKGPWEMSSVRSYDMPAIAKYFGERVAKEEQEKAFIGTFYDPMAGRLSFGRGAADNDAKTPRPTFEEMRAKGTAESMRLLRLQVQDFVKWLQGQGVI